MRAVHEEHVDFMREGHAHFMHEGHAHFMQVAVVIPALDESESLPRLIGAIPGLAGCQFQIIVVDNGSTDDTAGTARRLGATVVIEPRRGYGWACQAGVQAARASDAIVFMDADYSFDPQEMPRLINPLLAGQADMVLGSRLLSGGRQAMLVHQAFGNWLTAYLMRRLYGARVTDLAPYRAVRTSLLLALDLREMTFGYGTEMLVKAARRKARLMEVPVSYLPRLAGRSKVSGTLKGTILAAYFILATTFRYAVGGKR